MSGFYPITFAHVRKRIEDVFPPEYLVPQERSTIGTQHVMWMITQVEQMERTIENATKAARWLGWILAKAEEVGLWNNDTSRELVRRDVANGDDLP